MASPRSARPGRELIQLVRIGLLRLRNPIVLRRPGTQVDLLAALRAERTETIFRHPGHGLAAGGAANDAWRCAALGHKLQKVSFNILGIGFWVWDISIRNPSGYTLGYTTLPHSTSSKYYSFQAII